MNDLAIKQIETDGRGLIKLANDTQVKNQANADVANVVLTKITKGLKAVEEKRKSFTGPINQSLKEINNTFKKLTAPIIEAKQQLSSRLMSWRADEQRKQQEIEDKARREEERRRKISKAQGGKGEITPVAVPAPTLQKDTTKTRKVWKATVYDLTKLPVQYILADQVRINETMRAAVAAKTIDELVIPGVEFNQEEQPVYG